AFRIGRENGEISVPPGGKLAALHQIYLGSELGILAPIVIKKSGPFAPGRSAACAHSLCKVVIDSVGNEELRFLGPSVVALGETHLFFTERFPMRGCRALLVRGTVADMAVQDDESGTALALPEDAKGVLDAIDIVGVDDAQHVPPIGQEPSRDV